MRANPRPLSVQELRRQIGYDPISGKLFRLQATPVLPAGREIGFSAADLYGRLKVNGRSLLAHRVAWALATGDWPSAEIDHRNGDAKDNRLANLREATRSQNAANRRVASSNVTRIKGVQATARGKFAAMVQRNGVRRHLGTYSTPAEAHAAYSKAASELHGEYARA